MTPVLSSKQPQKTAQLQQDFEKNLAQFREHTVQARLDITFWLSNEYPLGAEYQNVRLFDSFAHIPSPKPLSEYRVAILTGEGGLFRGFHKLAANSDMTLQIDCDPRPLALSACLLAELRSLDTFTNKNQVLNNALKRLQASNPEITARQIKTIRYKFEEYTAHMPNNLFTDQNAFIDFKHFQDHPVVQVCLSYFSEEAMSALAQTLRDNGAVVHFFNSSNVCEYPSYFYWNNPYSGEIRCIPSQYMQKLPFSNDAICAYSQLIGSPHFTATCPAADMEERLYSLAIKRRNRALKLLAEHFQHPLKEYLEAMERGQIKPPLTTKIFLFLAEHVTHRMSDWILRLTAARLSASEVQDLKDNRQLIKTTFVEDQAQLSARHTQPALLIDILDKLTEDPMQEASMENVQSEESATNFQLVA